MTSFSYYIRVLDELRNAKGMSVSELCDNVISERTYYRYMHSVQEVKFDVFKKLAEKLGIDTYDIIHYAMFVRTGDPGITKFLYRVHIRYFNDIETFYELAKNYQEPHQEYRSLIQAYVKKYEAMSGRITQDEYRVYLQSLVSTIQSYAMQTVYGVGIAALYVIEFPQDPVIRIAAVLERLIEIDHKMSLLLMIITLDLVLDKTIGTDLVDPTLLLKGVAKIEQIVPYFPHKFFLMHYYLYNAYQMQTEAKPKDRDEALYYYLSTLILLEGHEIYQTSIERVTRVFGIDPIAFVKERSLALFASEQFHIISTT
jgi:transcriptional regulator with XRE-family HTH domain